MIVLGTPQVTLNLDWYEWLIICGVIGAGFLIRYFIKKSNDKLEEETEDAITQDLSGEVNFEGDSDKS